MIVATRQQQQQQLDSSFLSSKLEKLNMNDNKQQDEVSDDSNEASQVKGQEAEQQQQQQATTATAAADRDDSVRKKEKHDSGITSPRESARRDSASQDNHQQINREEEQKEPQDSARKTPSPGVGSDSGKGSESGEDHENVLIVYQFQLKSRHAGLLIGQGGANIRNVRDKSGCMSVTVTNRWSEYGGKRAHSKHDSQKQICFIKGTRSSVDKALVKIRELLPVSRFPDLDLTQVNKCDEAPPTDDQTSKTPSEWALVNQATPRLCLFQGHPQEVVVSSYRNAGHFYVQVPHHWSAHHFARLQECMDHTYEYTDVNTIPEKPSPGLMAVAPFENGWHRVQVRGFDAATDQVTVCFVDYGDEDTFQRTELRQMRSDFLTLPFQAVAVRLASVIPVNARTHGYEFPNESASQLHDMLKDKYTVCQGLGSGTDGLPLVNLTSQDYLTQPTADGHTLGEAQLVNRLLVESGLGQWINYQNPVSAPLS